METKDWRQECLRLQAELDAVRAEMEDWKIKWERLMQFKDAPRLPLRGRTTLDYMGSPNGEIGLQNYTTVGWDGKEDWK